VNARAVELEPLCESHAAALFPVLADTDLWSLTDREPPSTLSELAARYRRLESRRSPDGSQTWLNWAIVIGASPIGFVQATVERGRAEIAYVVGRAYQGRGYASVAVSAMLATLRADHGVARIVATVDARNAASLRLLARLGFAIEDASDPKNLRLTLRAQDAARPTAENPA
jgi:RimJ/RimL family protein N-acetyltransferase